MILNLFILYTSNFNYFHIFILLFLNFYTIRLSWIFIFSIVFFCLKWIVMNIEYGGLDFWPVCNFGNLCLWRCHVILHNVYCCVWWYIRVHSDMLECKIIYHSVSQYFSDIYCPGPGPDRRVGLLWRVQQDHSGSSLCHCCPGKAIYHPG